MIHSSLVGPSAHGKFSDKVRTDSDRCNFSSDTWNSQLLCNSVIGLAANSCWLAISSTVCTVFRTYMTYLRDYSFGSQHNHTSTEDHGASRGAEGAKTYEEYKWEYVRDTNNLGAFVMRMIPLSKVRAGTQAEAQRKARFIQFRGEQQATIRLQSRRSRCCIILVYGVLSMIAIISLLIAFVCMSTFSACNSGATNQLGLGRLPRRGDCANKQNVKKKWFQNIKNYL